MCRIVFNHVIEPSEWQRIHFETCSGCAASLTGSVNRLSMSLHVLISCVEQIEGLPKANINQANGDRSHRGKSLTE